MTDERRKIPELKICHGCGEIHSRHSKGQTEHDDPGDFLKCGKFDAERFFARKRDEVQGWWLKQWSQVQCGDSRLSATAAAKSTVPTKRQTDAPETDSSFLLHGSSV